MRGEATRRIHAWSRRAGTSQFMQARRWEGGGVSRMALGIVPYLLMPRREGRGLRAEVRL